MIDVIKPAPWAFAATLKAITGSAGSAGSAVSALVATAAVAGLLVALHLVVQQAVEQGALRRAATAAHVDALWRCNALQGRRARDQCVARLNDTPGTQAAPPRASAGAAGPAVPG